MPEVTKLELPSLAEWINGAKDFYDIYVKNKGPVARSWEEVRAELVAEHKLISTWDEVKLDRYLYERAHRGRIALLRMKDEIDRYRVAERARNLGLDSLKEMKDVHARAKKRKSHR